MVKFSASRLAIGVALLVPAVAYTFATSGVYSEEQAKHGQSVYQAKCAACHGPNQEGGDEAPPLKGDAFWSEWDQETARSLYSRIISTMPPDGPGTLAEKDVIDIVACLLKANGLPPGDKAIQSANELNSIKLARPK